MRELLNVVCQGLGIPASDLSIEEAQGEAGQTVTLALPLASLQTLDGREHRTAKALRLVLSASAAAKGTQLHLVAKAND